MTRTAENLIHATAEAFEEAVEALGNHAIVGSEITAEDLDQVARCFYCYCIGQVDPESFMPGETCDLPSFVDDREAVEPVEWMDYALQRLNPTAPGLETLASATRAARAAVIAYHRDLACEPVEPVEFTVATTDPRDEEWFWTHDRIDPSRW